MSIERATISDREWILICPQLSKLPKVKIGNLDKCRKFVGAVLWVLRGGVEWRMLPPEQGKWNIKAVIPPKSNRKDRIPCDFWHYKERHTVEYMFGKLKYYRRISTRYEKKAINYKGMLCLASVFLWLR